MASTAIDPKWAWAPFEPSSEIPWNLSAVAHLFRRAGFGATWEQLQAALQSSPGDTVQQMISEHEPAEFADGMQRLASAAVATGNVRQLSAWWAYRMLSTPAQVLEKTTLFWHGHFATSAEKVNDGQLMLTQNELLRRFALNDFGALVQEISQDPAMLLWLDSATNRKQHPNENYAREVMELFCLGEGNYTEHDIRELARCFTGWEVRREQFRINRYQHDTGSKTILGQSGEFDGEDGVRIVLSQSATAEFIVRKLIRFFVSDTLPLTAELIAPLAKLMRESDLRIAPVLSAILRSQLFFSPYAFAAKIRSPAELAIGFLRCLDGTANTFELSTAMDAVGQGLFFPPNVKGWDGGRTWINSSTLLGRSNLIRRMLESEQTRFGRQSLREYLVDQQIARPDEICNRLESLLLAVPLPPVARERLTTMLKADSSPHGLIEAVHLFCSLPEFQLC
ncbi:MAG: DUF1800 domain-containing protein [Planctomycetaceae bacterium]|nr:DUF1800 domain-containing protein [Planctomycetaceae bacterium]